MSGTVNSRSDPRLAVDAFVKLKTGGTETEYVFRTRDLSRNGFFLFTRVPHTYPLTIGASVTLELYDYDSSITCRCVVARVVADGSAESSTYPVGFGLKIVDIDAANRARFDGLLERLQQTGSAY